MGFSLNLRWQTSTKSIHVLFWQWMINSACKRHGHQFKNAQSHSWPWWPSPVSQWQTKATKAKHVSSDKGAQNSACNSSISCSKATGFLLSHLYCFCQPAASSAQLCLRQAPSGSLCSDKTLSFPNCYSSSHNFKTLKFIFFKPLVPEQDSKEHESFPPPLMYKNISCSNMMKKT